MMPEVDGAERGKSIGMERIQLPEENGMWEMDLVVIPYVCTSTYSVFTLGSPTTGKGAQSCIIKRLSAVMITQSATLKLFCSFAGEWC